MSADAKMKVLITLLVVFVAGVNSLPTENVGATCGYDACPVGDPNMLNVHLVPHTHNDVGWLKTIDEYFYGDKSGIQTAGVQYILDTVVQELTKDPAKRFVYVETAFFWRWWKNRDDAVHQQVQQLVQSGQLEFVGGGWCMNDEAGNYYVDTIDQMTLGFRFLNDTFGPCGVPRAIWQVDPFGHSRESASLFAQMGFDGLFLGRIDFEDKEQRQATNTMEMVWNASANLGIDGQIFTGVLPNNYGPPSGFCFDLLCSDTPIKDDPSLKDFNANNRADEFIAKAHWQAGYYNTNHIIMTMGEDFHYQDADSWFVNLDKLIEYVNLKQKEGHTVNAFYSTPSCYLQALNKAAKTWPTKSDDFFPYASDSHAYWTGYFTSRPTFKGFIKYGNNILQIGKQLTALANVGEENEDNLNVLKRAQGEAQHHDAVTGTAKQAVTYDYIESLATGIVATEVAINDAYGKLLPLATTAPPVQVFCPYLNVSYCNASETQNAFVVTAYNPLGHNVHQHVRVPVTGSSYTVYGPDGQPISSQIVPLPQEIILNPEKKGTAVSDLVFGVDLPPTGFNSYFVTTNASTKRRRPSFRQQSFSKAKTPMSSDLIIENEFFQVNVDGTTGLLKSITDLDDLKVYNVAQNFFYYLGMAGDNSVADLRASGAYIFRPNGTDPLLISATAKATLVVGPVVQEIQQTFSDYVSQVIRVYPGERQVELEWLVGPIPIDDDEGKEIITRYETDFVTNDLFYTDANGREVLERKLNFRPDYNLTTAEPVAGNYYPVNSRIYIQDQTLDSQLSVMTDRSHGGSSLKSGSVELMIHRRLLHDDAFGVGEALNETDVDGKGLRVRGKHFLSVSSIASASARDRNIAQAASSPPLVSIATLATNVTDWRSQFTTTFSGLGASLPDNVNLLTLEPWSDGNVLLRLEHFFEKTDDPDGLSLPVTVNLQNLFAPFEIIQATETTLGAHIWLQDSHRFTWDTVDTNSVSKNVDFFKKNQALADDFEVTLNPMQIRTFVVQISYK